MYKVKPVFSNKIWGGSKLKKYWPKANGEKIGEAWIISAYKDNSSELDNGLSLRDFYLKNREKFNNFAFDEFPLLVKLIDANDNLSIQVHPDNKNALELENYPFGKTECWYILDAKNNTDIIIGTNASSENEARELIESSNWDKFLKKESIKKDDLFDIKAGTVHAILKGTFIYELQQSSDITYRLYDFDRLDDQGNKRELHIEKSLKVINYNTNFNKVKESVILKEDNIQISSLINNEIYNLEKWILDGEKNFSFEIDDKNFLLVTVIEGSVNINDKTLNKYESGIITSDELSNIYLKGQAKILVANPNLA